MNFDWKRPFGAWLTLMMGLSPGAVHAQPTAQKSEAEREVDKRYKEGLEAVKKGEAEVARLKFLQAYAASKRTDALWNLAVVELDSDHHVAAAEHFRAFIADPRGDAASKAKAKELLETELWPILGHVRVLAPSGTFVKLDNEKTVAANEIVDVTPGKHTIDGGGSARREVTIPAGRQIDIEVEAGPHRASTPGPISAHADASYTNEPRFWTTGRYVGLGATIAGGATVIAAAAYTLAANSKASELSDARNARGASACFQVTSPECSARADLADARARNSNIAMGLWIGAGALVAGGVALLVFAKPEERPMARPLIVPAVSHQGASVDIRLRF